MGFNSGFKGLIYSMVLGRFGVVSLLIFAVRLVKPSLAVLRYGLLHIISCFNLRLQFFSELALLLGVSTLCVLSSRLATRYRYSLHFLPHMAMYSL